MPQGRAYLFFAFIYKQYGILVGGKHIGHSGVFHTIQVCTAWSLSVFTPNNHTTRNATAGTSATKACQERCLLVEVLLGHARVQYALQAHKVYGKCRHTRSRRSDTATVRKRIVGIYGKMILCKERQVLLHKLKKLLNFWAETFFWLTFKKQIE